jgi:hypothetical protein
MNEKDTMRTLQALYAGLHCFPISTLHCCTIIAGGLLLPVVGSCGKLC